MAVYRIRDEVRALRASGLDLEERRETLLNQDVIVASPCWMIIGRGCARSEAGEEGLSGRG